ncbi:unnamed protein product [Rhizophagus irregularis]|nr:unnamed protein product [Rhizophagus irregularis]
MTSESNNKNDDTDNKWIQWIKDGIDNEYINYHDYNEFQDMECIGVGGFGNVYRANWKSSDTVVALKSLTNGKDGMKEVVNEHSDGKRETPIFNTPIDYINIYTKCWQDNPSGRPEMQQVFSELKLVNLNTSELIEKCIKEKDVEYYGYNEFNKIEEIASGLVSKVYKAHWERNGKCVALKLFNLKDDAIAKEAVHEIKLHREVDLSNVMIKLFGITKTDLGEYLLITEYAEGDTLRNYLKENFPSLNWLDKYRLALQLSNAIRYLHEREMVHKDLHSNSILIQQNSIRLADSGLSRRIKDVSRTSINSFDTIPYTDPRCINIKENSMDAHKGGKQIKKFDLNEKSDIYSLGVIFWELSSGKKPFADDEYDSPLAMKIEKGLRKGIIERTPEKYYNLYTKCWDGDPEKRPTIQKIIMILESMVSSQHIIQHFKLNYGLFLDGCRIEPSKQAVLVESGELNMSLYEGHPLVYTFINDRSSNTNLLSFNSDEDCVEFNESLQPSDICINFPVAEITYTADLSESYSNFMDDDVALYEMYGHIFSKRILIGGKLFIDGLKSATSRQIDLFASFLTWAYDSARYRKENPFSNLSAMKFFPKITTLEEEEIDTPSKLINWINNLYQKNMASIISYRNLVPISELRFGTSSSTSSSNEKQPGVANFKGELSLEEWVKDYIYVNLARWIKELHLVQGLIISKHFELENNKKIAIDFINVPKVNSSDKSYLEFIKPTPTLEEFLAFNMINEDMTLLPFIKKSAKSVDLSYCDYMHLMINCERYEILLNRGDIKASGNFKQAIEEALESMKPHTSLQNVFDEYGYFFPLNIVLGKSLKNILPNPSSFTFEKSLLEIPLFESIKSHLDKLKIKYLLTKKGNVIEINDLYSWIQNTNDDLEIVKFDKIISLYDILEEKQKYKINIVLNNQDKLKIIMTGTVDLKDLDINNTEHFKRINVKPSLENGNYEVFGSIISKDKKENLKSDFFITFGLYDINGFSAMIKTLNVNNSKINITECYILWMIIGKPSELSVFSPKNRELQVYYMRDYITLQPDNSYYSIRTSYQLSQEDTISVNIYCSTTNCGLMDVKFVGWSKSTISLQIIYNELNLNIPNSNTVISVDNDNDTDPLISIDIRISILSSKYKNLKIDNEEKEFYLNLIGHILDNENFIKESSGEDNPNAHIKDKGKKRSKDDDDQASEHLPRFKLRIDEPPMDLDFSNTYQQQTISSPLPSYSTYSNFSTISTHSTYSNPVFDNNQKLFPQETSLNSNYIPSQEDNELNRFKMMSIDNIVDLTRKNTSDTTANLDLVSNLMFKEVCSITQNIEEFTPLIKSFLALRKEIVSLYEKAEHHKELCSFLLQRCNCAMVTVEDLYIRKTENEKFFYKQGNLNLFKDFIKCIKRIKNFIEEISQLGKYRKFLLTNNIEETFSELTTEFDGYMNSLNFPFTIQAIDEFKVIKNETREIKKLLVNVYGVSDDKQSQQKFLKDMDSLAERNKEFQKQSKQNKVLDSSDFKLLEVNEPLLDGNDYQRTKICPSRRIEKRTLSSDDNIIQEFCFKEFSNNTTNSPSDESQIEIRRQVNILKELKNTNNIIRFFGVAQENSKFYLVTEWMELGNLHEYYTNYKDKMNWETKIRFALDICCGISYLNDCQILHHDIQSANILVNINEKIKITNFGSSKKFYDLTRNISPNIENVRYMAPEKLLTDNNTKKEKVPYDLKCEIYSVGALLWEIAELKKPHSDLNKSEILVGIRNRVNERYNLPFSDGIPDDWKNLIRTAMLHEPACRPKISKICHKLHKLSKDYSKFSTLDDCTEDYDENLSSIDDNQSTMTSITILTVEDAIRAHKSKNGNKQLAWQSFKYHSVIDIYAKYMVGYYYYHEEVPELQKISKDERVRIAVEIFKETADKGNPSAQLRYGICLWQGEGISANSFEALKYLKLSANQGNSAAMYVIGKAYLNGGNGIEQDRERGAKYLKEAALKNHLKAKEMCIKNNIIF